MSKKIIVITLLFISAKIGVSLAQVQNTYLGECKEECNALELLGTKIISYNMYYYKDHNGISWKDRQTNFATHLVSKHRPAVIALQEVFLNSHGCNWPCANCENMKLGAYTRHLLDRINNRIDTSEGKYFIATQTDSNHAKVCTADEWIGDAIIYDSAQVNLIPTYGTENACEEWKAFSEDYYEYDYYNYSDCLKWTDEYKNDCVYGNIEAGQAEIIRAIFEYPKGSDKYFNMYSVHSEPKHFYRELKYITDRQNTFREDIIRYLRTKDIFLGRSRDNYRANIYPPIFAGDFNIFAPSYETLMEKMLDRCLPTEANLQKVQEYYDWYHQHIPMIYNIMETKFYNTPTRRQTPIDKILVGKCDTSIWDCDTEFDIVLPQAPYEPYIPSMKGTETGWRDDPDDINIYTDHSPVMAHVVSKDLIASLMVAININLF